MAGLGIPLFTDEMVNPRLAGTLVRLGYDVESCQWAGRSNQGIPDDQQLRYASRQGWVHAGIIISPQITSFAELLRRVQLHFDTVTPEAQHDTLLELRS